MQKIRITIFTFPPSVVVASTWLPRPSLAVLLFILVAPSWMGLVGAGSYETLHGRPRPVTAPCAYAPSGWS